MNNWYQFLCICEELVPIPLTCEELVPIPLTCTCFFFSFVFRFVGVFLLQGTRLDDVNFIYLFIDILLIFHLFMYVTLDGWIKDQQEG